MLNVINAVIDAGHWPALSALLLGVLTSVSPCPLAANVTAVAYVAKEGGTPRQALMSGLMYTLGRGFSYTAVAALIYYGVSAFDLARVFQGWGGKILGPLLIIVGLVMFGVIRPNLGLGGQAWERAKSWLAARGRLGAFALGAMLALAFCPYSGALFFGALMPLILKFRGGLMLAPFFGLGTGLPVLVFAVLLVFGAGVVGRAFRAVQKVEVVLRHATATAFVLAGLYYSRDFVVFLLG